MMHGQDKNVASAAVTTRSTNTVVNSPTVAYSFATNSNTNNGVVGRHQLRRHLPYCRQQQRQQYQQQQRQHQHHHYHRLAQELNNRGSKLISTGTNIEEGINLLTNALRFAELADDLYKQQKEQQQQQQQPCCCSSCCTLCKLESCLLKVPGQRQAEEQKESTGVATNNKPTATNTKSKRILDGCDDSDDDHPRNKKRIRLQGQHDHEEQRNFLALNRCDDDDLGDDNNSDGFVYFRPLCVNERCIEEGHYMGIALFVIIVLNLALAHHAKAILLQKRCRTRNQAQDEEMNTNDTSSSSDHHHHHQFLITNTLNQALKYYETSYKLHAEYNRQEEEKAQQQQRPMMANNGEEEEDCRQNNNNRFKCSLLFTMILSNNLSVLHRTRGNVSKNENCLQHLVSMIAYVMDRKIILFDNKDSGDNNNCPSSSSEIMDVFYRNVSRVVLTDTCARVA